MDLIKIFAGGIVAALIIAFVTWLIAAKREADTFSFLRREPNRKTYRVCGSNGDTKTGVIAK